MGDHQHNTSLTERERLMRASEWLLRLRDPCSDTAQLHDWLEWGNEDSRNLAAFDGVQQLARGLAGLSPEQKAAVLRDCGTRQGSASWRSGARRWRVGIALAASLVLAVLATLTYFGTIGWHQPTFRGNYATVAGQTRFVRLPDGSSLELAPRSGVRVMFKSGVRRVTLTRGEAWFKVHHDVQRPFVVQAGNLRLMDVGTAFDVREEPGKVVVSVAEGAVQVSAAGAGRAAGAAQSDVLMLVAGRVLTASGATRVVTNVNPGTIAEWRDGRLRFLDAPLSTVIAELDRYSSQQIVLGNPAVGKLRFTGTVFIHDVDAWLAGISRTFPVRVQRDANGETVLYLDGTR